MKCDNPFPGVWVISSWPVGRDTFTSTTRLEGACRAKRFMEKLPGLKMVGKMDSLRVGLSKKQNHLNTTNFDIAS